MDRNAQIGVSVSVFLSLACLPCRPPPPQPVTTTTTTAIPFRRRLCRPPWLDWTISVSVSLYERIPADTAIRYGVIRACAMVHVIIQCYKDQGTRRERCKGAQSPPESFLVAPNDWQQLE
uniref:Secreted protein n=1 Tax=Oryza glumipatula TaxID=40148 RepID=A0A0D9Y2S7_9ORYZ